MGKIYLSGRNQTKTVTPSNIQQTIEADTGFNALDSVVVNPIKAAMPQTLEQYIMRDDNIEPFSLNLDGAVPAYACYYQTKLVAVYGTPTSFGEHAFNECVNLQEIDCRAATSIGYSAFYSCTNLRAVDCRAATSIGGFAFRYCTNLRAVDCRAATSIDANAFNFCTNLNRIDITNTSNATLASTNSIPNNANLVIIVADDTDKAHYQSATNWSTYASKIKTVAEFEQQIGMSYDVYYEQIFGHPRFDTQGATV